MKLNMYLGKKHPVGLSELVLIITAANFLLLMHMLILQPE